MVTNDDDSLAARRHMMTMVMQETIATLCQNMLSFEAELCVEGLLGITLDKTDVILLNIKQVIPMASMQTLLSDEASNGVSRNETGCDDQSHDPSAEIRLFGKAQSRARQLNSSLDKGHSKENSCPALNHKDSSGKKKLHVSETDLVAEEPLGSKGPEGERMQACDLESGRANDPKSSQTEDCDVLETESCSELLTRTRKWKEKLDHLNVECATQPWNNMQVKEEHLDELVETACELPGYAPQNTDSFDLSHQARNFQLCRERSTSGQSKWLNFSSSDPSGFNNSDLMDHLNSYSLSADNHGDLVNQCTMCMITFTTKHHLKRHNNAIHSRSPLLSYCPICRKAFRRRDTMKRHCRSVHYKEMGFDALDWVQFTSIDTD